RVNWPALTPGIPRWALLSYPLTPLEGLGPPFQPTEEPVGRHPVDRQGPRPITHDDVGSLSNRLFADAGWQIIYGKVNRFILCHCTVIRSERTPCSSCLPSSSSSTEI